MVDLDLSQRYVLHCLIANKEVVFYQVLEYEVGRDSLRQASHTPWAVDSVQFTCVEPDHVNLTAQVMSRENFSWLFTLITCLDCSVKDVLISSLLEVKDWQKYSGLESAETHQPLRQKSGRKMAIIKQRTRTPWIMFQQALLFSHIQSDFMSHWNLHCAKKWSCSSCRSVAVPMASPKWNLPQTGIWLSVWNTGECPTRKMLNSVKLFCQIYDEHLIKVVHSLKSPLKECSLTGR